MFNNNLFVWFLLFFLMNIILLYYFHHNILSSWHTIIYIIIQELFGLLFLMTSVQWLWIMCKFFIAPFHLWVFHLVNWTKNIVFIWLMAISKLNFIGLFMLVFNRTLLVLLLLGVLSVLINYYFVKGLYGVIILNSIESFNWILLLIVTGSFSIIRMLLTYVIIYVHFMKSSNDLGSLEVSLLILSLPLLFSFMIKILTLVGVLVISSIVLIIMLLMTLSIVGRLIVLINTNIVLFMELANTKFLLKVIIINMIVIL